jgi:hypothetical protein
MAQAIVEPYGNYCARRADELEAEWLAEIGLTAEEAALGCDEDGRWTPPTLDYKCETCCDTGAVTVASKTFPGVVFQRPCPDCVAKNEIPTLHFRRVKSAA